jgi:hypothetical protein
VSVLFVKKMVYTLWVVEVSEALLHQLLKLRIIEFGWDEKHWDLFRGSQLFKSLSVIIPIY